MVGDDQTAVAFGTAAAESPFIDNGDLPAFLQQVVSSECADNSAADDDG